MGKTIQVLLSKHILALGSIGSGKSNLMYHIVKSIIGSIKENDIIVFFDAKGDYLSEFYREGDFVVGNKNRLGGKYKVALWNIYKDIIMSPEDEQLDTIREITSLLFKKYIDSSQSPTFIMGARDILTALITYHLREMKDKNVTWNNKKLRDLLNKSVAKDLRENISKYDDLLWATSYIMSDKSPTTQSYLSPLFMVAQEVFTGSFADEGDFSIREAIQKKGGKSIFLEYDIANGNVLQAIYTVLIDLAMKEALGQNKAKGNVFFILDEFPLIPKLNYMDNALNFGRSLGVKVIAGIQNVGQVENTYSKAMAQSLLSGFGTFFCFKLFDEKKAGMTVDEMKNSRVNELLREKSLREIDSKLHLLFKPIRTDKSEKAYRLIQNRTEIHELTVANNCLLKEYTDELQKKDKDINYICKIKSSIDDNDLQVDKEYLMEKKNRLINTQF